MEKKILHIISQYPDKTGSGIYLRYLIKEFSKLGYSQRLIYAVNSGDKSEIEPCDVEKDYPLEFDTELLPFKVPGMSDTMPYESLRYCDMTDEMIGIWKSEFRHVIESAVAEYSPDIVMTHHLWLATALTAEIVEGVPIMTFCHGTDIRQMKKGFKQSGYIVENCRKVDKVFALSSGQKDDIEEIYGIDRELIEVIGGGFDTGKFCLNYEKREEKKAKLIYVGKLSYSKGVKSLIRAYEKLEEDVELILVGSGEGEEHRDIVSRAKLSKKKIEMKGQVSQEELAEIFKGGDIFVMPSFYEGLSLVTIEAIASGLRAVVSEIEGLKECLGDRVNTSGIIEYVELPKMRNIDEPLEEELEGFEKRLTESIKRQLERKRKDTDFDCLREVYPDIIDKSWRNIALKVDEKVKSIEFRE